MFTYGVQELGQEPFANQNVPGGLDHWNGSGPRHGMNAILDLDTGEWTRHPTCGCGQKPCSRGLHTYK